MELKKILKFYFLIISITLFLILFILYFLVDYGYSLKNREFRNCLAHYGLGQFLDEIDIDKSDVLKGLTNKAFNMDYYNTKKLLYKSLFDLCEQIKNTILI